MKNDVLAITRERIALTRTQPATAEHRSDVLAITRERVAFM